MLNIHNKIIREVLQEKKKEPKVVAILLFGSIARGTAHEGSDVDIEIIYDGKKHKEKHELRYGVKVDFEYWPKDKLTERVKKYPYLSYPYLEEKILYDPEGFAKKIKVIISKFFKKNPGALKDWKQWTEEYLAFKKNKIEQTEKEKIKSCNDFYDRLEIMYSKLHKVTREF